VSKLKTVGCKAKFIKVVPQWNNHYEKCYDNICSIIKNTSNKYDLWLVSAGEIGRIYSGLIKECGGRSLDIGFLSDYWCNGEIPVRLKIFIDQNNLNPLEFMLTNQGMKYEKFL